MTEDLNTINGKERTTDVLTKDRASFDNLFLSKATLDGLEYCKFYKPSPIQLKAIPLGKCGFDLIIKSKSGTGKTAVFAVVALEMVKLEKLIPQAIILAPTREIAYQIAGVIKDIGTFYKDLKVDLFIGGLNVKADITKVNKCHIIVGTPGRIKHLILEKHININEIKLLVLDEADKLLCDSLQGDINYIYNSLLKGKQIIASSATYPDKLDDFVSRYMITPTHVSPKVDSPLLLGLKQYVSIVNSNLNAIYQMKIKNEEIQRILSSIRFTQCLIFCNFQSRAESMCNALNQTQWKCAYITGAQSQEKRLSVLKNLKELKCRILFSSDLTARGIDAINIDLVINCDVPNDTSTYLHRMGRAGRYGSKGVCITLATKGKELEKFQNIIGIIGGTNLSVAKLPCESLENFCEKKIEDFELIYGVVNENYTSEEEFKSDNIKQTILELKNSQVLESEDKNILEETASTKDLDVKEEQSEKSKKNADLQQFLQDLAAGRKPKVPEFADKKVKTKGLTSIDVSKILNDDEDDFNSVLYDLNHPDTQHNKIEEKSVPESCKDISEESVVNDSTKNVVQEQTKEPKVDVVLQQFLKNLAAGTTCETESTDNSNKRKRNNNKTNDIDKRINNERDLHKNSAWVEVSKLINDDDDDLNIVQNLKDNKTDEKASKTNIENIFVDAFNYAITKGAEHWKDTVGDVDFIELKDEDQEEGSMDQDTFKEYDEESNDYNYGNSNFEEIANHAENQSNNEVNTYDPKHVDVRFFNQELENINYYNRSTVFKQQYDQLSSNLMEESYKFEDAESFMQWFPTWQRQVCSMTDYVQQNIYLQEMNHYQYHKNQ